MPELCVRSEVTAAFDEQMIKECSRAKREIEALSARVNRNLADELTKRKPCPARPVAWTDFGRILLRSLIGKAKTAD